MSAHSHYRHICRKLGVVLVGVIAAALPLAARASSIGLYTDETGSSCSFSGNNPGPITAYVMIRPDERGLHGVRFSAPIPSCLGAVFVRDVVPLDAEMIGDSQTGISVAFGTCATTPRVALQIEFYRNGSTGSCCAFAIEEDPFVEMIEGAGCTLGSYEVAPVVSHFNANASCACEQAANLPPSVASNPSPTNNKTDAPVWAQLAWKSTDPEGEHVMHDVYFGETQDPPLVASELWDPEYNPGTLAKGHNYYWRIVARDPHGLESEGPLWTFHTLANHAPSMPANPSPEMSTANTSLNVNFQWTCSDYDQDALAYDVYFGTADSLPLVASNITSKSYDPGPLAPATFYRWRIVARDTHGNETPSVTWLFSTLAVESFSVVAAEDGVNVTWQLLSDERIESFTLYRSDQTSGPIAVAQGPVSGTSGSYLDTNVDLQNSYRYQLSLLSNDGKTFNSSNKGVATPLVGLALGANQPNPFNPQTTIPYSLEWSTRVRLAIYDPSGALVKVLVDERQTTGMHRVVWNGRDAAGRAVASGVYFSVLQSNGERRTQKMVLLK
jgi:hypothetical protein